jgi:hypothetical protein
MARVNRETVDLSDYPDLVMIYLGMQVHSLTGMKSLAKLGPGLRDVRKNPPAGMLRHENFIFQQWPLHLAFRQYWRDLDAMEAWTRSLPHQKWWREFLQDPGDTGFWHEAYSVRGGVDCVYDDMTSPVGLQAFAPVVPAAGPLFSARGRLRGEASKMAPIYAEEQLPG